jgi:hypothetical protein
MYTKQFVLFRTSEACFPNLQIIHVEYLVLQALNFNSLHLNFLNILQCCILPHVKFCERWILVLTQEIVSGDENKNEKRS